MKKMARQWKKHRVSILFAAPFLLIFTVFTVIPVISAMILSLTNYNVLQPATFVGLDNYLTLFLEDDVFLTALKNTFLFALITGPVSLLACLFVAWMINEFSHGLRTILTVVFYSPAISGAVYTIWKIIFSNDSYGIVNSTLENLGFISEPIQWLSDPKYIPSVLILAVLWASLGTSFLAMIAGLKGVNHSLYEAGAIDGIRNRIQELWYITIPAIKPQLMFSSLISITSAFEIGAVCTTLFGFPSPNYAAHTLVLHMEDYGTTRYELGMACSMATILFVIMVVSNKLVNTFIKHAGK